MGFLFAVSFFLFLKSLYLFVVQIDMTFKLFAILQKYEFSSKSQPDVDQGDQGDRCLRYCKSTSFQANHNDKSNALRGRLVVCDTAKVRVFKQITTVFSNQIWKCLLFAILQKYEFSSKSQHYSNSCARDLCCLRYCKSTSFQANHNPIWQRFGSNGVVCDTAKVRVFKQITTTGKRL